MKPIKRCLSGLLAALLLLSPCLSALSSLTETPAAATEALSQPHQSNQAYLPFGWVHQERSDSFIQRKLQLVASYGIDTVYFSLGSVTLDESGQLLDHITQRKADGLWTRMGQWAQAAQAMGITLRPILDCQLNDAFLELDPATQALRGQAVQTALLDTVSQLLQEGLPTSQGAFLPTGVHLDCEPFRQKYHDFYLSTVEQLRALLGQERTLSAATPAKNGSWSQEYLAQVCACLDQALPMLYDSNGPSTWGGLQDGVTQNEEEYIQLVEDTALWYSQVLRQQGLSCQVIPTVPAYPDASTTSSTGWPEEGSGTVWYHLSTIESTANCILGIQNALRQGADIPALSVWNFYYLCGDAEEYQLTANGYASPEADTTAWMSWVKGLSLSHLSYTDSRSELSDPERGFYHQKGIALKPEGCGSIRLPDGKLLHLRLGLASLSPVNNDGAAPALNDQMLQDLSGLFAQVRQRGQTAVIRFAYDNFNGVRDMEPPMEVIEGHIAQLAPVFQANADVIASVEAGFLGPWGEMHSSQMATQENFSRLIDALLAAVPESVGIAVRQPQFFANWVGVDVSQLDSYTAQPGTPAYRVGIFNDGYLASGNDLGTYRNRETEVTWLEKQATHTLFGGEAVLNNSDISLADRTYSSIGYAAQEMFRTHTSYLNVAWNDKLIAAWREETYQGEDKTYYGLSAFQYIRDHLGYRYVLRSAALPVQAEGTLPLEVAISNVGFGNVVKEKRAELLFVQGGQCYPVPLELDVRTWLSRSTQRLSLQVPLPAQLTEGACQVYLRLSNDGSADTAIHFANPQVWEQTLGGNYLGSFTLGAPQTPTPSEEPSSTPTPTPDPAPSEEPAVTPEPSLSPEPSISPEPSQEPAPSPSQPGEEVSPTPTPAPTATIPPQPDPEPAPRPTQRPAATPAPSESQPVESIPPTPTPEPTPAPEPTPEPLPLPEDSPTPTPELTVTPDPQVTATPEPALTPLPAATPAPTPTPRPAATARPVQRPQATPASAAPSPAPEHSPLPVETPPPEPPLPSETPQPSEEVPPLLSTVAPLQPLTAAEEPPCSCLCHATGPLGLLWPPLRFFYRLFHRLPTCPCGVSHY